MYISTASCSQALDALFTQITCPHMLSLRRLRLETFYSRTLFLSIIWTKVVTLGDIIMPSCFAFVKSRRQTSKNIHLNFVNADDISAAFEGFWISATSLFRLMNFHLLQLLRLSASEDCCLLPVPDNGSTFPAQKLVDDRLKSACCLKVPIPQ